MKKITLSLLIVFSMVSLSGCTALLVGTGAAAAGVGIAVDTVRLERNIDKETAWNASKQTLEEMGKITSENGVGRRLKAEVEKARITVEFSSVQDGPIWVDVKARKNGLPDLPMANKIVDAINSNIRR
ncbi:MAG: DUF3568 family protein [PVC group bacterium]|nr:DUF3568 family protein [PVC group bacterium]